jgi:hypothetical protein
MTAKPTRTCAASGMTPNTAPRVSNSLLLISKSHLAKEFQAREAQEI